MNHREMILSIAHMTGLTPRMAKQGYDATCSAIKGALKRGDMITLSGFGTFYVGKIAARNGTNPRTGAIIRIKAAKNPKFRPSTHFRNW